MIDLYTWTTPNGRKATILLEELGVPYNIIPIDISKDEQFAPDFLKIAPNNRIPAMVDHDTGVQLMESGAIMMYLAQKYDKFQVSGDEYWKMVEWLMWQMGGLGPMLGQLGFFYKFAGSEIEDNRPRERYINEAKRLLGVLEKQLEGRDWICGDYSIADIAVAPWVRALDFYEARDVVGWDQLPNVAAYLERFLERPAVQIGLNTPPREG